MDDEKNTTGRVNITSPYYLNSGDQQCNLITYVAPQPNNYILWARTMTLALKACHKIVFLEGKIDKPRDAKSLLDEETITPCLSHGSYVVWIPNLLPLYLFMMM